MEPTRLTTDARVAVAFDCPHSVTALVRPLLARWLFLAPSWLHTLDVCWQNDGDDTTEAAIDVRYEYRTACLTIYPRFLEIAPDRQSATIRHEVLHTAVAPLERVARAVVERACCEDSPLREWAGEEVRVALESVVTDLTRATDGRGDAEAAPDGRSDAGKGRTRGAARSAGYGDAGKAAA